MKRFAGRTVYLIVILVVSSVGVFAAMRAIRGANSPSIYTYVRPPSSGIGDYVGEYIDFISGVISGDWGQSFVNGVPVSEMVAFHGRNTLILGGTALILVFGIGVPLGMLAAWRRNTKTDAFVQIGAAVGVGFPHFWLGLLLVWLFGPTLGWLPTAGCCGPRHLVLPAFVLAAEGVALTARMTRSAMLDNLHRDFVTTLRSGGLAERRVLGIHVLRNALVPIVSIIGLRIGQIVGSAIVVEVVFGWPGLGWVLVNSVRLRDYPVAQFFSLVLVATVVVGNWLANIAYVYANPRLRRP